MKDFADNPLDDQSRYDRLADGELSGQEYKQLLASLDDEPGGWRRCALAFLEAQALRQDLPVMLDHTTVSTPPSPARAAWTTRRPLSLLLAMAASFLVAFGLGVMFRGGGAVPDNGPPIVKEDVSPDPHGELAENNGPNPDGPAQPLGHLTLVVDGPAGTAARRIQLPVYDLDQVDRSWFSQQNSAVPDDMIQALQRMGHWIKRHRQLVPFNLQDGRRVIVPVEDFQIIPVSERSFQ